MSDVPTSIRLPRALKAFLQKFAKSKRQKLAPLIVHILELWMEGEKK